MDKNGMAGQWRMEQMDKLTEWLLTSGYADNQKLDGWTENEWVDNRKWIEVER